MASHLLLNLVSVVSMLSSYMRLILMYYKCQVIVVPFELKIVLVIFKTQRNCYYGYKYETLFSLILFF